MNPWLRCPDCERIHLRHGIGPATKCVCGRSLWPLVFNIRPEGN